LPHKLVKGLLVCFLFEFTTIQTLISFSVGMTNVHHSICWICGI
jgi:hypothetical protein